MSTNITKTNKHFKMLSLNLEKRNNGTDGVVKRLLKMDWNGNEPSKATSEASPETLLVRRQILEEDASET